MSHRVKTVVAPPSASSADGLAPPLSRFGRCFFCCGWAPTWLTECAFAATRACLGCCCFQTQSYTSVADHHAPPRSSLAAAAGARRDQRSGKGAHAQHGGDIELQLGAEPAGGLFAIDFESEEESDEEEEDEFDDDLVAVGSANLSAAKAHAALQLVRALCTALHSFSASPPKYSGSELKVVFDPIGALGVNSLARALLEQQRRFRLLQAHMEQSTALEKVDPHTAASFAASERTLVRSVEFGIIGIGDALAGSASASGSLSALKKLLSTHQTLDSFSLWGNQLTVSSIRPIARGLAASTCVLRTLNLANNELTDSEGEVLAEALAKNRTLTKLDLTGNQLSDASTLPLLTHLSQGNRLVHLLLGQNRLSDACCPSLAAYLKLRLAGFATATACQLETLDLSTNLLTDLGVVQLCAALQHNSRLVQLSVHGHGLSQAAHLAAQQALDFSTRHFPRLVRVITVEDEDDAASPSEENFTTSAPPDFVSPVPATVPAPSHPLEPSALTEAGELIEDELNIEDELAAAAINFDEEEADFEDDIIDM